MLGDKDLSTKIAAFRRLRDEQASFIEACTGATARSDL